MISFKSSLKKATVTIGLLLLLNILVKVIFQFKQVETLMQELSHSKQPLLMLIVVLGIGLVVWVVLSLFGGIMYYGYQQLVAKKRHGSSNH